MDSPIDSAREANIEFVYHIFAEADAKEMVEKVRSLGFGTSMKFEPNKLADVWVVRCRVRMMPTSESIDSVRNKLCDLADEYENWFLGWGILREEVDNV